MPWSQYAFYQTEKAHIGQRSREWTAVGNTEAGVHPRDGALLRKISEGWVPK